MSVLVVPVEPGHLAGEVTTFDGGEHWPIVALRLAIGVGETVDDYTVQCPDGSTWSHSELDAHPAIIAIGPIVAPPRRSPRSDTA